MKLAATYMHHISSGQKHVYGVRQIHAIVQKMEMKNNFPQLRIFLKERIQFICDGTVYRAVIALLAKIVKLL